VIHIAAAGFALTTGCGRWGFYDEPARDARDDASDTGPDGPPPHPLQITVTGRGAAAGSFGVCTSQCTVMVTGDVAVSAYPADAWSQSATASCASTPCTVPADVGQVDIKFTQAPITANLAFVSSTPVSQTSGAGALDSHCQTLAAAVPLSGTFVAFVSTTTTNARARLNGSRGWVRVDGVPILDQNTDTGSQALPRAIVLDEKGVLHPTNGASLVATGSNEDGTVDTGNNCGNYSTTTMQMSGGYSYSGANWMLGGWVAACTTTAYVYCFQTGKNVAVQVAPGTFPVGRRVFVTRGTLPIGSAGAGAADPLCQTEATAAGLTGTYRAVIATTTQSAADRVGPLTGPWRRTDDVLVTLGDLDTLPWDTTVGVDAAGASNLALLDFGAEDFHALGVAANNCDDWTNPGGSVQLRATRLVHPFVAGAYFGGGCGGNPVLCAELP
jgi:hypothetical protein